MVTVVVGPIVAPVVQEMLLGIPSPVFATVTPETVAAASIRLTSTPMVPADTATPKAATKEPTPTAGPRTPTTGAFSIWYDDFSDSAYDGNFNTRLWNFIPEEPACEAVQQGGLMIISNTLTSQNSARSLRVKRPPAVQGNEKVELSLVV